MKKTFAGIGLLVLALTTFVPAKEKPAKPEKDRLLADLTRVLLHVAEAEPNQEGQYHQALRLEANIHNAPTPAVFFEYPYNRLNIEDGTGIVIKVSILNWTVVPSEATSAGSEFAIGKVRAGSGHTHIWGYNDVGDRVRFTGATGLTDGGDGYFYSAPFNLPPGEYQFFVALQNDDHTAPIPSAAQDLPAVDSVYFTVGVPEEELLDDMARLSEMKRYALTVNPLTAADCLQ